MQNFFIVNLNLSLFIRTKTIAHNDFPIIFLSSHSPEFMNVAYIAACDAEFMQLL